MEMLRFGLALLLGSITVHAWAADEADNNSAAIQSSGPELRKFVLNVVNANPRVQAAQSALEASMALKDAASRPLYNPELNLDAENSETDTRVIGISQTLDWGGKRKARSAVAESDRLVVEAEYLATRWAVTVELLDNLSLYQTGVKRNQLADSRQQLMNNFADLAKKRFNAGDLNQVEFDLARLAATQARIQKATAGSALAEARQGVRNLTLRTPSTQWPSLPDATPVLPLNTTARNSLLLRLPDVMAAQRLVESADAVVELRRRERRPDPTLSLAGGDENGKTLVGLNLSLPLFIRNNFKHEVRAAIAERSQAQQIADDVLQRANSRLISAAERYQLSQGAWGDWLQTGQTSLMRQTQQLQKMWEAGELSTTDYLVQLTQTLDVQESALDLRNSLWRAWFEWLWASGQVNTWIGQSKTQ